MARDDAYAMLPANAAWSCSFGYPGEGGFNEYWRTPWQCKRVDLTG